MDDWESEDFEPKVPAVIKDGPKGHWDDEDAEDDGVKESWEDEDTTEKPKSEPPKPVAKAGGKKGKASESKAVDGKAPAVETDVLADPVAEKLRQQRIVEEADFKSTTELFARKGDDRTLDNFIPKTEIDFKEYAELISYKLRPYEKSFHYMRLLKDVMRLSMTTMKAADAKELASSVTAIANEKLKAEKEANAGKKKLGGKKKQLLVDKPDDEATVGEYDALDDYDFM